MQLLEDISFLFIFMNVSLFFLNVLMEKAVFNMLSVKGPFLKRELLRKKLNYKLKKSS